MESIEHLLQKIPHYPIETALSLEEKWLEDVVLGTSDFVCELWQTDQCLVAPRSFKSKRQFDTVRKLSAANHWPVYTRSTGGDATPQGPGIVNVSVVCSVQGSRKPSIEASYIRFCNPFLKALKKMGLQGEYGEIPKAFCNGKYNININGQKLIGTAQRWRRLKNGQDGHAVLFHALILISPPNAASISALNYLLQGCGEERIIALESHTGLEQCISPDSLDLFFSEIKTAYKYAFT